MLEEMSNADEMDGISTVDKPEGRTASQAMLSPSQFVLVLALGLLSGGMCRLLVSATESAEQSVGRVADTPWFAVFIGALLWAVATLFLPDRNRNSITNAMASAASVVGTLGCCTAVILVGSLKLAWFPLMLAGCACIEALSSLFRGCSRETLQGNLTCTGLSAVLGASVFAVLGLVGSIAGMMLASLSVICGTLLALHIKEPMGEGAGSGIAERTRQALSFLGGNLLAPPVLFTLLWAFTAGTYMDYTGTEEVFATRFFFAGLAVTTGCIFCSARFGTAKLSFLLLQTAIPAYACLALALKVIPVSLINGSLYKDLMDWGFKLAAVLAWSYASYAVMNREQNTRCVLASLILACGAAFGLGTLITLLAEEAKFAVLGVVTSVFLLYMAISLGRSAVEYVRPNDEAAPANDSTTRDIASACQAIAGRYGLTARETEVLVELASGHSSKYVAGILCVTPNTVRSHTKNIYAKLGISSRDEMLEIIRAQEGAGTSA